MRTLKETYRSLLAHFPPGLISRLGANLRLILEGLANFFLTDASNRVDSYRAEVNPATCVALLPAWEDTLDLAGTKIATFGTLARRRRQLLGSMRAQGDLSIPGMRAAVAPFLDYADPDQIQILEPDRVALMTAHSVPCNEALSLTIPKVFPGLTVTFTVLDDGPVSDAGAQLIVAITGDSSKISFELRGPGGTAQQCFFDNGYLDDGVVAAKGYALYGPPSKRTLSGFNIEGPTKGTWILTCLNNGTPAATLDAAILFVEAMGRNGLGQESLGNELHYFAIVADVALMGPLADLEAARDAAEKQKPAYTGVALVVKDTVSGGAIPAIPDLPNTIPDESIPG